MAKQHRMFLVIGVSLACGVFPVEWTGNWVLIGLWVIAIGSLVTCMLRLGQIGVALRDNGGGRA
jgi:hypothetical protein